MMRSRTHQSLFATAMLVLLLGACSGPKDRIRVSVKEFPTDVILGAQGVPVAASPAPTVAAPRAAPTFTVRPTQAAPRATFQATPTPTGPCPAAHPFDSPKRESPTRSSSAPAPATYQFRNKGTFDFRQGNTTNAGALPALSSRTIRDVVRGTQANPAYQFRIVESLVGTTTTTSYFVRPESAVPGDAGVFISRIETLRSGAPNEVFVPQPMIKIFEFPAMGNLNWKSSGADPTTGASMTIQGRIGVQVPDGEDAGTEPDLVTRARVDACGEVIDAWLVEIGGPSDQPAPSPDGASIIGPGLKNLRLRATYAIATQFGAFSVFDKYTLTGTEADGRTVRIVNEATISSVPKDS